MEEQRRLEIVECSTGDKTIEGRYHRFNKLLGKGAFKKVYKAFDTIDQVDVAWNSIDLSAMTNDEKDKVFSECEMLQKLNHPNILKIRDKWKNLENEELIFVTDIIQNGSLRSYFKKRRINVKSIKSICYQILLALQYLHRNNVIHRDLKCDNVFIDSNNNKVVLGDLGLSVNFEGQSRMSIVGTPHWMAPELYNEKYNELVDIWSFGMCVLELTTNKIPYKECKNTIAVYNKVMIEKEKPDILYSINDPYIKSFINICLDFNYKLRPTANELLSHPFLWPRYPRDYVLCDKLLKSKQQQQTQQPQPQPQPQQHLIKKKKKKIKKKKVNKNDVQVQNVVSKRNFITTIKLQIYRKNDKPMAVTFDFNINIDKPCDVADEMIQELGLEKIYKLKVQNAIEKAIQSDNNSKTQIIGQSLIINNNNNNEDNNKDNILILPKDLSSYLNSTLEIDEKSQEQIKKKRQELLKEYNDFVITKQELLKLRIESITENELREQEILKIKTKIQKKKYEIEKQYENFINDYKDIAYYNKSKIANDIAQNFMFENDKKFINLMQSKLSIDDKYEFKNNLRDYRQQIVDKYLSYYSNLINQYSQ